MHPVALVGAEGLAVRHSDEIAAVPGKYTADSGLEELVVDEDLGDGLGGIDGGADQVPALAEGDVVGGLGGEGSDDLDIFCDGKTGGAAAEEAAGVGIDQLEEAEEDSGWQDETSWTEFGIAYSRSYTYRVKAPDKALAQNETVWSSQESAISPPAASLQLLDEDFQDPTFSNGFTNPGFIGWAFNGAKARNAQNEPSVPGNQAIPSQVIQFEYTSQTASYDLCHAWSAADTYNLTVNASPLAWNGTQDRYLVATLLQQDNTQLWASGNTAIPHYAGFGRNPWTAAQTFTFEIKAGDFVTGTPGQDLRLKISSAGTPGIDVDNVSLEIAPPLGTIVRIR